MIATAMHYGHTGQPWPPGRYWIIEHVRVDGPSLFWSDALDAQGRTCWSYIPQSAAGFASQGDAVAAYSQRGHAIFDGGTIEPFEHIWGNNK